MDRSSAVRATSVKRKLADNLTKARESIAIAAAKVGRDPSEIKLVAVTKSVGLDVIRALVELGQCDLGESRVQQLVQRAGMLNEQLSRRAMLEGGGSVSVNWHMIGHLQRNKIKPVLPVAAMIHSVDTLRLAEDLNSQAGKTGKRQDILIQVDCAGETQKYGMPIAAVGHFIEQILPLSNLRICGLMAMAPLANDGECSRLVFDRLYEVFLEVKLAYRMGQEFQHLSMGMSQDFMVAVECGATMLRLGTTLFEGIETQVDDG